MSGLTPEQAAMIERLRNVLTEDERVLSAWLSGSIGQDRADAFSDVDVTCVVEEEDLAACVAEYGGRRNPVGPTVHQTIVYGRVAANTAPDWMRYDLAFMTPVEFRGQDPARLKPLVRAQRPPTGKTFQGQIPGAQIAATAAEFIRILGLLPVAVGRREWLSAVEGLALMRRMTIDLMIEANGRTHERGGVKKLNPLLTDEQRAALEATFPATMDQAGMVAANLKLCALFFPVARELAEARQAVWPDDFEAATRAHLKAALGFEF